MTVKIGANDAALYQISVGQFQWSNADKNECKITLLCVGRIVGFAVLRAFDDRIAKLEDLRLGR